MLVCDINYSLISVSSQLMDPSPPVCTNIMCPRLDLPVVGGRHQISDGGLTMVGIGRNIGLRKNMTPVINHNSLRGLECRAILAHQGGNVAQGHWLMYAKVGSEWWRVDTCLAHPQLENPFVKQLSQTNRRSDITLDGFFYKM